MSSSAEIGTFDYVVVGGGTAGAVVAARLSEDPDTRVCLIEAGPSDVGMDDVLLLRRWLSLLEGPIDLAYPTTLQPRGNAHIVHSRAAVLGGCSSHNTQIFFKPLPGDWQDWVDRGASGCASSSRTMPATAWLCSSDSSWSAGCVDKPTKAPSSAQIRTDPHRPVRSKTYPGHRLRNKPDHHRGRTDPLGPTKKGDCIVCTLFMTVVP